MDEWVTPRCAHRSLVNRIATAVWYIYKISLSLLSSSSRFSSYGTDYKERKKKRGTPSFPTKRIDIQTCVHVHEWEKRIEFDVRV